MRSRIPLVALGSLCAAARAGAQSDALDVAGAEVPPGHEVPWAETPGPEAPGPRVMDHPEQHVVSVRIRGRARGLGIVLASGRILTSLSVVGSGRELSAKFADGSEAKVRVLRTHRGYDLALLLIDGAEPRVGLDLSMLAGARVLEPLGASTRTSRLGAKPVALVYGADSVEIRSVLVATRELVLGTSVVDEAGRLSGMAVLACVPPDPVEGQCRERDVVLPVTLLHEFLQGGDSADSVGWLGARVELHDEGWVKGLRITTIEPGSPAQASNLESDDAGSDGDLLVALNGVPIGTPRRLHDLVTSLLPGTEVDVLLVRAGVFRHITVRLGAQPRARRGWQLQPPLIQPPSPWPGF